ncbi:unnamed protein product, partial [Symbiodinium sp. CCMP2456]
MCGTFVDEVPQEFHRERKAVSERILETSELALPVVQAITADDATADLNPEAVEQIMVHFQDHVTQALATEQRIHPPQPTGSTTGVPEFYRISDPLGADTFLGSRCPELDADYREAILLEGFIGENEAYSPFPGGSSDDGAPGDHNVEELNDALEREAVEDAQRELDEALERARQQMDADEDRDDLNERRIAAWHRERAAIFQDLAERQRRLEEEADAN